ncbi:RHBDL1_2_3 [Lepeophtheirus salmonis]|uniref:RHBDL1_2_3 n=1 Tax=Lepeophtheirus salmonis TaxID=72036 RepID=A0A7R8CE35_LEPSM|nr:RHBDL1_2_3 [Lepeophtheirus salmonis]CAF2781858.1 RHBDL1_2_3 [Lepeophtheirus salmonis]
MALEEDLESQLLPDESTKVKKQLTILIPGDEEEPGGFRQSRCYTAPIFSEIDCKSSIRNNIPFAKRSRHISHTDPNNNQHLVKELTFGQALSRTWTFGSVVSAISTDEWKPIFHKLDKESDGIPNGKIPMTKFKELLDEDPLWKEGVPSSVQERILQEVDRNKDGVIDFDEFIELVKGTKLGLSAKRRRAFRELLKETVDFLVPYKYSYQNQYSSCSPPPFFMITISLLQVLIFIYGDSGIPESDGVPYCSSLIYNPYKRSQVWRYLTYMLVHSGLFHLSFNLMVQLILGIPLEMVHGWWRVMSVYVFGRASGGVYSLITAHLGTVIMNYREMAYPLFRFSIVLLITLTDIFVYIYDAYVIGQTKPISYPAHIFGAITGLLVGITVLKNLQWQNTKKSFGL